MKRIFPVAYLALGLVSSTPLVEHCHGHGITYRGIYRDQVETFLSIPYGHDTSGEHRFQPPRPYIPARGRTIDATAAGPACPQTLGTTGLPLYLGNITDISEDCLHLNVYRPNGTRAGDNLPVLLHIHGGSFILGSKDELAIQPSGLILESIENGHPVMAVNINYRMGVFGFAKSHALHAEGSLNAGLRDQRLAMEWVRENIARFGGDPEQVTIYGQSSGGLAVGIQIMAYGGSRPVPFQKAICESQALEPGIVGEFTNTAMKSLTSASKCNSSDIQDTATISCLRSLSMAELLHLQTITHASDAGSNIGDTWLPAVDGDFLPEAPSTLIAKGKFANISTIIGWCQDDTNPFVDSSIQTANDTFTFFSEYLPGMSPANVHALLALYPVADFHPDPSANLSAQFYRSGRILRDILMVCEPFLYGAALAAAGNSVYLYDQDQTFLTPELEFSDAPGLGVVHTSEFAYVFGNLSHYDVYDFPFYPNATDYALLKRESRSWSSFASMGRPSLKGHDTLQGWEGAFDAGNETRVFVIGGAHEGLAGVDGSVLRDQRLSERCGFLNQPHIVREIQF